MRRGVRTEGTALSRNRGAMLEATRPASSAAPNQSGRSRSGSRSSRRKRRRGGIVLPAFLLAVLLVGVVAIGAKVMSRNGSGANSLAAAIDALPRSGSVALLAKERQTIIVMNAAAKTYS